MSRMDGGNQGRRIAEAKRRLARLKLASVTASVIAFGGLSSAIAAATSTPAVAATTSAPTDTTAASTTLTMPGPATDQAAPPPLAPIVSAQS